MISQQTTIYVDDAAPKVIAISDSANAMHIKLVPQRLHNDLQSEVRLTGTVAELRDWIGALGLAVAEAEEQIGAERADIDRVALSESGSNALGEVASA